MSPIRRPSPRLRPCLLLALLAACGPVQSDGADGDDARADATPAHVITPRRRWVELPPPDLDALREEALEHVSDERETQARELAARLEPFGRAVDLGLLQCEERRAHQAVDDLTRQVQLFQPPDNLELQQALLRAMDVDVAADQRDFLRDSALGLIHELGAYYQADRQALVFMHTPMADATVALFGWEPLVLHELVHARQERHDRLVRVLSGHATVESMRTAHTLLEGEAELVTSACMLAEGGHSLFDLDPERDLREAFLSGTAVQRMYATGRRAMIGRFQGAGWPGVAELLEQPPPSTEQLLHLAKLGRDLPTPVARPSGLEALGLSVEIEDVFGELMLYDLLMTLRASGEQAQVATTAAAEPDWVDDEDTRLAPAIVDGHWQLEQPGLRVPVPAGWRVDRVGARVALRGPDADDGQLAHIDVQAWTRPAGEQPKTRAAHELARLTALPFLDLLDFELTQVAGVDAVRFEVRGTRPREVEPSLQIGVVLLLGGRLVRVTASLPAAQAEAQREAARTALDGVGILDTGTDRAPR